MSQMPVLNNEESREVVRQVAVYAGFRTAGNALATMITALEGPGRPSSREVSGR